MCGAWSPANCFAPAKESRRTPASSTHVCQTGAIGSGAIQFGLTEWALDGDDDGSGSTVCNEVSSNLDGSRLNDCAIKPPPSAGARAIQHSMMFNARPARLVSL